MWIFTFQGVIKWLQRVMNAYGLLQAGGATFRAFYMCALSADQLKIKLRPKTVTQSVSLSKVRTTDWGGFFLLLAVDQRRQPEFIIILDCPEEAG